MNPSRLRIRAPGLACAVILPALVLSSCGSATADHSGAPGIVLASDGAMSTPAIRVETARIAASDFALELTLPGEISGSKDALLASPSGGFVEALLVNEGDTAKKGQALARINTSIAAAQRDQAAAQLALAQSELERVKKIGDLASQAQLDAAQANHDMADAGHRLAEINVARSVIRAPFTGTVANIGIEEGEVAGPGAPAVRLVRIDPLSVTVSVSDRDIGAIAPGLPVKVHVDAIAGVLDGQVIHVSPAADLKTRAFMVELEVDDAEGKLRPGMIANVSIAKEVAGGAIVLPQDFLVTRLDGVGVFVVEHAAGLDALKAESASAVARWRPLRADQVVRNQVLVTEGLEVGDEVVTVGHRGLADGDPVLISRSGQCCDAGRITY